MLRHDILLWKKTYGQMSALYHNLHERRQLLHARILRIMLDTSLHFGGCARIMTIECKHAREGHNWHYIESWGVFVCVDCGEQKAKTEICQH
jgi:hypothetical protein